jgi:tRNA-intron endonuclease
MTLEGETRGEVVRVGGDARQRFHDSRGYGRPAGGDAPPDAVDLAPVEAAHLLYRGDLEAVDGDGFRAYLVRTGGVLPFVVYRDLRDRGFYLSPAREGWVADPEGADVVVHPRGTGPWDGEVAHRVRVIGERDPVPADSLGDVVLAVVDEEGELSYLETDRPATGGTADYRPPGGLDATLLGDRALVWDPPADLYERGFYGQHLYGRNADEGPLQLALVEAAHLARQGALALDDAPGAVVDCGRAVEGERFDRRLAAYESLRAAGSVPKSGFKFGADFRVYDEFESVSEMGHSDHLVRVTRPDHAFVPRDLALDVRLAVGVRKRMVFALTAPDGRVDWLSVARLTP